MTSREQTAVSSVDLAISGMTCASCAARIEKKLNKLDGVAASVNFATETAHVDFPASLPQTRLIEEGRGRGVRRERRADRGRRPGTARGGG